MTQKNAQQEVWWDEFLSEYGKTPLRELARRFDTNPRRLRRAAQRLGLTSEAEAIREGAALLGQAPDATVASKLKVTVEAVKGARVRRNIPAYNKAAPPPKPEPVKKAAPKKASPKVRTPKAGPEEPAVVVKRRPTLRSTPSRMPEGAGLGRLGKLAPADPDDDGRPLRRRRVVKKS